ncbi:dehydrogenase/reductase SDR family protein 7-like [Vanessa atalanta]|uniref:dehydrogenase/reductase SDR family protein 7-like n=1 Tax=Vanessa atalanta TaxID=42275 RepID=UPI001FCDBEF5|nr:dehydrogenase/reductase SDR family protein 7-like [Vanessa atalanta]XP_047528150.1 dehydrogenase/reductase SDR family protein 7-like [Vanessa atalanta]XP_047528151.1 dehydrogenase/reductase SDR family protein 7-like [Vanessa atalanta]
MYAMTTSTFKWYLKYLGLPLSIIFTMYRLCKRVQNNKIRNALQGKVVVVTGASSGIGEALAHVLYENGCKVILASRRINELNRVKEDLLSKKNALTTEEPLAIELDLSNLDQLESFVNKVYESCGKIDILINNGGVSHRGSILHTKLDVDQKIMLTNYLGSVGITKAVLPRMVERKSGHIVFISSVQGLIAIPDRSAYAASKHALQAFGDCLRSEMYQHNIDVSVVSPGYVKTSVSLNALTGSGESHGVMDSSTAAGFSAEYVAMKIVDLLVNKDKELIISQFLPNLAITIRHSMPFLYFWIMARRANKTA